MENRTAFFVVGIFLLVVGFIFTSFLCGVGVLFLILGGIMGARDD